MTSSPQDILAKLRASTTPTPERHIEMLKEDVKRLEETIALLQPLAAKMFVWQCISTDVQGFNDQMDELEVMAKLQIEDYDMYVERLGSKEDLWMLIGLLRGDYDK